MTGAQARLSLRTLACLGDGIDRPSYDPAQLRTGIVHLGIGAFHRAHQATLTDRAADVAEGGWGIVAATQRSARVVEQMRPQNGLFTLVSRDGGARPMARVVGSVRDVLHAGGEAAALSDALAAPATRIVSTTVTEKGYGADLGTRTLEVGAPLTAADLADGSPYRTVVGQLVGGFTRRMQDGSAGLTVLCCDNVQRGGDLLRSLCRQFLASWSSGAATDVRAWIDRHVRFPNTLVDRIVPATTAEDLRRYSRILGYQDDALVTAEPYGLWVIEDDFAAGHPAWPAENVKLVADIGPWSDVKLRLLNGAHSLLAYLGLLAGAETIGEVVGMPALAHALDAWLDEASRSLAALPEGLRIEAYRRSLVDRFGNPGITHRLEQIAMDGSLKLPARTIPAAADLVGRGQDASVSALALAAWLRCLQTRAAHGDAIADPAADRLTAAVTGGGEPRRIVDAVFGADGALPVAACLQGSFLDGVARWMTTLRARGALPTARMVG